MINTDTVQVPKEMPVGSPKQIQGKQPNQPGQIPANQAGQSIPQTGQTFFERMMGKWKCFIEGLKANQNQGFGLHSLARFHGNPVEPSNDNSSARKGSRNSRSRSSRADRDYDSDREERRLKRAEYITKRILRTRQNDDGWESGKNHDRVRSIASFDIREEVKAGLDQDQVDNILAMDDDANIEDLLYALNMEEGIDKAYEIIEKQRDEARAEAINEAISSVVDDDSDATDPTYYDEEDLPVGLHDPEDLPKSKTIHDEEDLPV